ncbi:NAD(P)H-dependent flavin oxidoreductase [Bradyrhizobium brasilense]|uniref:NAD(P)H-dependent flavin oxidoreductase n=1 Tax=Bradyrhizobium brasilense TaxID=1419277 RepID=UPI001E34A21F|nr:nitronate monooxygenase [Bradyrhizobium brasilense]MCC8970105.1 nitronate monooxygenase [Bradyrhizobium brasilense]
MVPAQFRDRLRLPAIVSPMFLVSGPDLVVETCRSGLVGSFPSLNQRTSDGCEQWLRDIRSRLAPDGPPFAMQFAVHPTHRRLDEDLTLLVKYEVPILISALGITREVTDAVHGYGGLVFHDAINVRHAKKALEANVDGIIAVCAGAGGHAGTYNPFAFLAELKPITGDKTLILSGCIGDGHSLAGAIAAGADLGYIGTRFVNTVESIASDKMKRLVLESDITNIVYSAEIDGVGANWLEQTMPQVNLLGDGQPGKLDVGAILGDQKRWRDILSVGQGVGSVTDIPTVADLVDRLEGQFLDALDRARRYSAKGAKC